MESIIASAITGALALLGVIITNNSNTKKMEQQLATSQAVTETKIEQLTEEVRKHNSFGERLARIEARVDILERSPA